MKGFASRISGEEVFTWVYRKNSKIYESNTRNVNVEKYFYGRKGEDVYADDIITELEANKFSHLILRLKDIEGSVENYRNDIAHFISHLLIRTKNFRNSFYDLSENASQRSSQYLSNPANIEKLILSQPSYIKNQFDEVWESLKLQEFSPFNAKNSKEKIYALFAKHFSRQIKISLSEFSRKILEGFSQLESNLPQIIRDAHINCLKERPIMTDKIDKYSELNWFVLPMKTSLILSDSGCIFEVAGKRRFKTFDDNIENLINIFLPLSSQKLLVGSKYRTLPNFDIKLLNKVSACCSYDLFISSENSVDNAKFSKSIGSWSKLLSDEELNFYISNNKLFSDIESAYSLNQSNSE